MSQLLDRLAANGTTTWNGAVSNATTGFNQFGTILDYFTKAGTYRDRPQTEVDADMARIFADDEAVALKMVLGLRLITRTPHDVEEIEDAQTGFGRKDEFFKAVVWLNNNKPEMLYRNLHLIPLFGCWKDLFSLPLITVLDRQKVYQLVKANLDDQLLRKYLPQIRSKNHIRTRRDGLRVTWARGLCRFLGISEKEYRLLKSAGTAHQWQQQMAAQSWDEINFNAIPGKAMLLHTSQLGKDKQNVFERHDQIERLKDWVLRQPRVKFNGYPYELTKAAAISRNPTLIQKLIYNRQFETLLDFLRDHKLGNTLACLDTSGSMKMEVCGPTTAYDICLSMGLVFSALNVGHFKDVVVAFDSESSLIKLAGEFCDRLHHLERMTTAWGSTNFQSVIDLLVKVRTESPEIPVDQYPETLLIISDMQFNPVDGNTETNYSAAMRKLSSVGLSDVRIIWWVVNGAGTDFPSQMHDRGVYMIGGFDPTNIKALLGLTTTKPENENNLIAPSQETPLDGMMNFFAQPIFRLIT